MLDRDVMGLVLPDITQVMVGDFTTKRSLAALPFAGRYRLIDFTLSNMVNAEIDTVAVLPSSQYHSLIDHLGSGKPWDLNRKYKGLSILPPKITGLELTEVELIYNYINFLRLKEESYVMLSYGNTVYNESLKDMIEYHKSKNADLTIMYHDFPITNRDQHLNSVKINPDGSVSEIISGVGPEREFKICCGVILFEKAFLINMVQHCYSRNLKNFVTDYLQKYVDSFKVYGYKSKSYFGIINDISSYYNNSMNMLTQSIRNQLFAHNNLIYTKVKDSIPTRYGPNSIVSDSLVADGCLIDGTVKNSIIFRGVHIGEDSLVENSIVMQNGVIYKNVQINSAILDKGVVITEGKRLSGDVSYPFTTSKGAII